MSLTLKFSLPADEVGCSQRDAAISIILKAAVRNGFTCDIGVTRKGEQYDLACTVESAEHALLLQQTLADKNRRGETNDLTYHITNAQLMSNAWATAAFEFLGPLHKDKKCLTVKYPQNHPIAWAIIFKDRADCSAFVEAAKTFGQIQTSRPSWFDSFRLKGANDDVSGKRCSDMEAHPL